MLCSATFSASNPSRTASEHLKRGAFPNFAVPLATASLPAAAATVSSAMADLRAQWRRVTKERGRAEQRLALLFLPLCTPRGKIHRFLLLHGAASSPAPPLLPFLLRA